MRCARPPPTDELPASILVCRALAVALLQTRAAYHQHAADGPWRPCVVRRRSERITHVRCRKVGALTFDFAEIRLLRPQAETGVGVQQLGDEVFSFAAHLGRKTKLAVYYPLGALARIARCGERRLAYNQLVDEHSQLQRYNAHR